MKFKSLLVVIVVSLLCTPAMAGSVNQAGVKTFQDGTPAVAGEVNGNFQALITAINDNAARIAALEGAATTAASLTGTWEMMEVAIDVDQGVDVNNGHGIAGRSLSGTIVLNNNGSGTYSITEYYRQLIFYHEEEFVGNPTNEGSKLIHSTNVQPHNPIFSENGPLTWTLANNLVTVTIDAETVLTFIVAGPRLLIDGVHNRDGLNGLTLMVRR